MATPAGIPHPGGSKFPLVKNAGVGLWDLKSGLGSWPVWLGQILFPRNVVVDQAVGQAIDEVLCPVIRLFHAHLHFHFVVAPLCKLWSRKLPVPSLITKCSKNMLYTLWFQMSSHGHTLS